uniref:Uncharacterized protein n=1 Tax=Astyanax mexicanus TaxID=7994 RepID=A0A8B9JTY8_ASTMX
MALLLEHRFLQIPNSSQIHTGAFLDSVSHLPPFFGEVMWISTRLRL